MIKFVSFKLNIFYDSITKAKVDERKSKESISPGRYLPFVLVCCTFILLMCVV